MSCRAVMDLPLSSYFTFQNLISLPPGRKALPRTIGASAAR